MKHTVLSIVILVAAMVGTNAFALENKQEPEPTGTLVGYVFDVFSIGIIANARVVITPGNHETQSNFLGRFQFNDLAYRRYAVTITAEGYYPYMGPAMIDSPTTRIYTYLFAKDVAGEGEPDDPNGSGSLAVIVTNADTEQPIGGATVTLGEHSMETPYYGVCVFTGLAHGQHTLTVVADSYEDYSSTVTIDSDETKEIEVSLQPEEGAQVGIIGGHVMNSQTLHPIEGATVTLIPGDITVQTAGAGGFLFANLSYGTYTLQTAADGYQSDIQLVSVDGTSGSLVNILLTPLAETVEGEDEPEGEEPDEQSGCCRCRSKEKNADLLLLLKEYWLLAAAMIFVCGLNRRTR